MKNRLAKIISYVLSPFLVSSTIIVLLSFESTSSITDGVKWSLISLFISVVPVFAIIVFLVRKKKLEGIFVNSRQQRTSIYLLASILGVVDYVILLIFGAPVLLKATFISGMVALVIFMGMNFLWKISLHTAFISASVAILIISYGWYVIALVVLLPVVSWARMEMKLHSLVQVVTGAILAAAVVVLMFWLFNIFHPHLI